MLGLYLHIPFCRQKCLYCDFPSYAGTERFYQGYVQALCREIDASPYKGQPVDTVYFGGGTPSLLPGEAIAEVLAHLKKTFSLTPEAEITLEANPESLTAEKAALWYEAGINRLSIGIQSFNDELLLFLGRVHTAAEGKNAVLTAYEAGFRNLSIDLMYGLPGQSVEDVACDLLLLDELPAVHASIYSLIVEDGTRLKAEVEKGKYALPPAELLDAMNMEVHQKMQDYGFTHYEISSYAKPGYESRHNSKYWTYAPYLGFGVSAHSFMPKEEIKGQALTPLLKNSVPRREEIYGLRWMNQRNIPQYIQRAGRETVIHDAVVITEKRAVEDYCFLALRRRKGIDAADFARRFGRTLKAEFGPVLRQLEKQGLLKQTVSGWALTALGLSYGNYVFGQFIR